MDGVKAGGTQMLGCVHGLSSCQSGKGAVLRPHSAAFSSARVGLRVGLELPDRLEALLLGFVIVMCEEPTCLPPVSACFTTLGEAGDLFIYFAEFPFN